jgi:5-methylcytosine-specific restriction endonuclease McrBC regulatory subunit McrC
VTRIAFPDLRSARQTGSFRHYRRPIHLAGVVLRHLGISPEHLDNQIKDISVPQFALCTYELFERYTEAALRKQHQRNLWPGYTDNHLGRAGVDRYRVRPDFLLIREREIIDCKYKFFKQELDDNERPDAYQLVSYSRHRAVLDMLGGKAPSKLTLLYPEITPDKTKWEQRIGQEQADGSFEIPLERRRLGCPSNSLQTMLD